MNKPTPAIGILGGTFDPVHKGHIQVADELYRKLGLQEVRLLPCQRPILKGAALASCEHRLAMLKIATNHHPGLGIDTRELDAKTPMYTCSTLKRFRQEFGTTQSLCFIMGADNLLQLPQWQDWQTIPELAHLIVVVRPGYDLEKRDKLPQSVHQRFSTDYTAIAANPAGSILLVELPPIDIASTEIRTQIKNGQNPQEYLPEGVWGYILRHSLYK